MTKEEFKTWFDGLKEDAKLEIFKEHRILKQTLCAEVLLIPTGADNWLKRSILKARSLIERQRRLKEAVHKSAELFIEVDNRTGVSCQNCVGTGFIQDEPCCMCRGTGL